jgi:hypothetical protein
MPALETAPTTASFFGHCLNMTLGYAERLLKDIPADKFAFVPHDGMNHPAFCIGHLSLYPNRLFNLLGRTELVVDRPGYAELFQAGAPCLDDANRYPKKDDLVSYYFERYRAFAKLLPSITDETLQKENPLEGRMKELFPTIGAAMCFLLNNHQMVHLGQISAWRRAAGLGAAQ